MAGTESSKSKVSSISPHGEQATGRGSSNRPQGRFESLDIELDEEYQAEEVKTRTRFYQDYSKSIISKNDSPDIPFDAGINPYRGCEHGCIYCYARPTHEYLGLSAGLDFESKIFGKSH